MYGLDKYKSLAVPPTDALKRIDAGKLKGKTDINPQWKIEAMTEAFGLCGVGWKFEIVKTDIHDAMDGQKLIFMTVAVRVKENDTWGEPVYGCGGDFIVEKNKNGLVPNDEAYKMCLTDALGNALKCLGVAADIYRGYEPSKYQRQEYQPQAQPKPQQAKPKIDKYVVTMEDGEVGLYNDNGSGPYSLSKIPTEGLAQALNNPRYAEVKEAIQTEIDKRESDKIPF